MLLIFPFSALSLLSETLGPGNERKVGRKGPVAVGAESPQISPSQTLGSVEIPQTLALWGEDIPAGLGWLGCGGNLPPAVMPLALLQVEPIFIERRSGGAGASSGPGAAAEGAPMGAGVPPQLLNNKLPERGLHRKAAARECG